MCSNGEEIDECWALTRNRSISAPGTAIPSNTSSSVEPPSAPSFSFPTITEHATAPTSSVEGSLIPARDKDLHLEFEVNNVCGQEKESEVDIEMDEDAQTSEDAEIKDVASATAVLSAAVTRSDTFSSFEPTPVDSPDDVPTLDSMNEPGRHCCKDSLGGSGNLAELHTSVVERPNHDHGTSTQQTEPSPEVVSGSSEPTSTLQEAPKGPEREAVAEKPSKKQQNPSGKSTES